MDLVLDAAVAVQRELIIERESYESPFVSNCPVPARRTKGIRQIFKIIFL